MLEPGSRIWVNVPATGYVGVGQVTAPVVKVDAFTVDDGNGKKVPIEEMPIKAANMFHHQHDDELAEYLVGVVFDDNYSFL